MRYAIYLLTLFLNSTFLLAQEMPMDPFSSDLKKVTVTVGSRNSLYGVSGYYYSHINDEGEPVFYPYQSTPPASVSLSSFYQSNTIYPGRGIVFSERRGGFTSQFVGNNVDNVCGAFADGAGNFIAPHKYPGSYNYQCSFYTGILTQPDGAFPYPKPSNLHQTFQPGAQSTSVNPIAVPMASNVSKLIFGTEHAFHDLTGSVSFDIYMRPVVISDLKIYQGEIIPDSPQTTTALVKDKWTKVDAEFYLAPPLYTGAGLGQHYYIKLYLDNRHVTDLWFQISDLEDLGGGKFRHKSQFWTNEEVGFGADEDFQGVFRAVVINGEVPLTPRPGEPGFTPEIELLNKDLQIETSKLVQAVYEPNLHKDSQFDLALNKPAHLLFEGKAVGFEAGTNVEVRLIINQVTQEASTLTVDENNKFRGFIPIPTDSAGTYGLQAEIIPHPMEANIENNLSADQIDYRVVRTYPLRVGYQLFADCRIRCDQTPEDDPDKRGPSYRGANDFSELQVEEIRSFIKHAFPVASNGSSFEKGPTPLTGHSFSDLFISRDEQERISSNAGVAEDFMLLTREKILHGFRKYVGVAPPEYFKYHFTDGTLGMVADKEYLGLSSDGYVLPDIYSVALTIENDPPTLIHELGHNLGQSNHPENTVDGFNNYLLKELTAKYAIMDYQYSKSLDDFWLTKDTYQKIFSSLLSEEIDPEIIIIQSLVDRNGILSETKITEHPEGLISNNNVGNIKVSLRSEDNEELYSTTTLAAYDFQKVLDDPMVKATEISLEKGLMMLSVPKIEGGTKIAISVNGFTPTEFALPSAEEPQSLVKSIQAIILTLGPKDLRRPWKVYKWLLVSIAEATVKLEKRNRKPFLLANLKLLTTSVKSWVKGPKKKELLSLIKEAIDLHTPPPPPKPKIKPWWKKLFDW